MHHGGTENTEKPFQQNSVAAEAYILEDENAERKFRD